MLEIEDAVNFLYLFYKYLRSAIESILGVTLAKANPVLVSEYANAIAWLITLTAVFLILEFFQGIKKVLGIIIALGWLFLFISLAITTMK